MDLLYVSFSLRSFSCCDSDSFEKEYSEILKPLIKFLNKHPDFHFSFSFSGPQLSFLKKKKSEFLKVLSELVKRGQCEIYGSGFYSPALPLILPADRNGQIEMMSSEIRQTTGKAPRGFSLHNDIWDSSLLQTLNSCSMDYFLLDESNIPQEKRKFLPVHMTELGKSKQIFYVSDSVRKDFFENDSRTFLTKLKRRVSLALSDEEVMVPFHTNIVNVTFTSEDMKEIVNSTLFSNLASAMADEEGIVLSTINEYNRINSQKVPAFISSGLCPILASIIEKPYEIKFPSNKYTVYDFLQAYPRSRALYNRMLFVSQLVNQPNREKTYQKLAREKLWEGQSGEGILCPFKDTSQRQIYYKKLMDAEKIIRETMDNKESVVSFDYDNDGIPEYVCSMKDYFSVISLKGGSVHDFQSVKNTGNYTDNYSRVVKFDGCQDRYVRGFFVDHLFNDDQFNKYLNQEITEDGVFSRVLYEEIKFSSKQNELSLKARAVSNGQIVSILKKYIINSSGMNIQYIIKNESESPLKAKFCVESNLAQVDFTEEDSGTYKVLLATDTEAREVDTSKSSRECFDSGSVSNINVVQITDEKNGISFSFEPNENCNYCFYPIKIERPDPFAQKMVSLGITYVSTLFWDIDIQPGKEIEKNFNFTIFSSHKIRKKNISK